MATINILKRQLSIIGKLRQEEFVQTDDLLSYLDNIKFDDKSEYTQRTIQRDIRSIDELRISLHLKITNDFVMELLARSRSLTVISPASLRERINTVYREALNRNSKFE